MLVQVYPYLTFPSSGIVGSPPSISPLGKCNEVRRADPSQSQEHKQSISAHLENWDSAFNLLPPDSHTALRTKPFMHLLTHCHSLFKKEKNNEEAGQKNTPHCPLSRRTPAIENAVWCKTFMTTEAPPVVHTNHPKHARRSTRRRSDPPGCHSNVSRRSTQNRTHVGT